MGNPVSLDDWKAIGIVCGALLALLSLLGIVWRKAVGPLWRAAWKMIRRMDRVADDLLGDPAKGIPSMADRMAKLEREHADPARTQWHTHQRPNGGGGARQSPRARGGAP